MDILPASLDLAATEVIMYTTPGREFLFREIVKGLEEKYPHTYRLSAIIGDHHAERADGKRLRDHTYGRELLRHERN